MSKLFYWSVIFIVLFFCFQAQAAKDVNMTEVRALAKLPVDSILEDSHVDIYTIENYWSNVRGRNTPVVVFFYSNYDGGSQRIATLIKYLLPDYGDRVTFGIMKIKEKGKPSKDKAEKLESLYSLDKTPGILFYDNVGTDMVLEDEDYIDADFKEFRSPRMFLWKKYYSAIRKELDELLSD